VIEEQNLEPMSLCGELFCTIHFDFDEPIASNVIAILASDPALWSDFQHAVRAHRPSTHSTMLLEHVFAIGKLLGKSLTLDQGLYNSARADRRQLSEYLNSLDGEIAFCRDLADRRSLAARINCNAGSPIIDGLTLRALTYVFGDDPELWREFQSMVAEANAGCRAKR
jgi:hypothetical protein